ncbi:hypothetical protein MMC28_006471 [Mycoblastus sanguinarius]|nr:hypothetical protein [Mycoblastus sanguinarius]
MRLLLSFFALAALLLAIFAHRVPDAGEVKRTTTSASRSLHQPPTFKFNHVGISVANLPAQIKWYSDILGFDKLVLNYTALLPLFHTVQLMDSVGTVVELQSYANSTRLDVDKILNPLNRAAYQGIFHFALRVDDLNATYTYLGKQGVTLVAPPSCVDPYGCSAFVADPEENIIELVHYTFD